MKYLKHYRLFESTSIKDYATIEDILDSISDDIDGVNINDEELSKQTIADAFEYHNGITLFQMGEYMFGADEIKVEIFIDDNIFDDVIDTVHDKLNILKQITDPILIKDNIITNIKFNDIRGLDRLNGSLHYIAIPDKSIRIVELSAECEIKSIKQVAFEKDSEIAKHNVELIKKLLNKYYEPDDIIHWLYQLFCYGKDVNYEMLSAFTSKLKFVNTMDDHTIRVRNGLATQYRYDMFPSFVEKVYNVCGMIPRMYVSDDKLIHKEKYNRDFSPYREMQKVIDRNKMDCEVGDIFIT